MTESEEGAGAVALCKAPPTTFHPKPEALLGLGGGHCLGADQPCEKGSEGVPRTAFHCQRDTLFSLGNDTLWRF